MDKWQPFRLAPRGILIIPNKDNTTSLTISDNALFRLFWQDPRLAFERRPGLSQLLLGARILEKLWLPDIFIVDELDRPYSGPATNENTFVRITHTGEVLWSRKRTVRVQLDHNIGNFYYALLDMESFSSTMSDIRMRWQDGRNRSVQVLIVFILLVGIFK